MRSLVLITWLIAGLTLSTAAYAMDDDAPEERIRTAVEAYLAERFPDYASRLGVRVLRLNGTPPPQADLRVRFSRLDGVPRGHAQLRFESQDANGSRVAGTAHLYVSHYDSVAVAGRDLLRGDELTIGDLDLAWLDLTTFRGQPLEVGMLDALRAGATLIAERSVAAGEALRAGDLRPPHVAGTGDRVMLRYQRGPVTLMLPCQAREPGAAGEVIRVYSDTTRTTYKARLHADGTAEWVATL